MILCSIFVLLCESSKKVYKNIYLNKNQIMSKSRAEESRAIFLETCKSLHDVILINVDKSGQCGGLLTALSHDCCMKGL
jgi:hypothetical protein